MADRARDGSPTPAARPLVVAVVLALLALTLSGCSGSSPTTANGVPSGTGTYMGVPVGFTQLGYPSMGSPGASVTIEEYSDLLCPYCGRHFASTMPTLIEDYVATGKVKYVFRDMPLAELHPNAPEGHVATRCVAEQGPQLFWSLHDDLFSRQEEWRNLPSPTEFLAAAAEKAGADPAAYRRCVDAGVQKAFVDASLARATTGLGFSGTPSFRFIQSAALAGKADPASKGPKTFELVGAYPLETFAAWLDALLAGQEPPGYRDPNAPAKPETLPAWASPEGLAPDPARPGFTAAGDPYRGSPKAGVTVVAFSNFQCSHCRTHALDVQPAVDKAFVDTGKVRWVSKNLPLRNLPQSTVAAVAAECAGEQGHYWPMYRLLFETQRQWSVPDPEPVFRQLAGRVGADGGAFAACYNSRQALEGVLEDMYAASGVVSEAPAFVFVFGGKAAVLRGSKPAADFVRTVQGILDEAAGGQGAAAAPDAQAPATTTSTTP